MLRWKNVKVKEETIDDVFLAVKMLKNNPRTGNSHISSPGSILGAMLAPRTDV